MRLIIRNSSEQAAKYICEYIIRKSALLTIIDFKRTKSHKLQNESMLLPQRRKAFSC